MPHRRLIRWIGRRRASPSLPKHTPLPIVLREIYPKKKTGRRIILLPA